MATLAETREAERESVRYRRADNRKAKNSTRPIKRRHFHNLTGNLVNQDNPKLGYKFWKGQKPVRVEGVLRDTSDLRRAISEIYHEGHSANEYSCESGLYMLRLKFAQHSRDTHRVQSVRYLMKASFEDFSAAGLD
jgi:hypothetical protein